MNRPPRAAGPAERVVVVPEVHRRQRRPTGAPPPLPKKIGLTGMLWLAAVLVIVVSGVAWLHVTTGPLDHFDAPIIRTSLEEAEFQKYVHNVYNAVKIAFFNEMRIVAQGEGWDATTIFQATAQSSEGMWNPIYGMGKLDVVAALRA